MKDKLKSFCLYYLIFQTKPTWSNDSHFYVDFICFLALPDEYDCVAFAPVGKQRSKEH